MALKASNMMDLGTRSPDFLLTDVISGKQMNFEDVRGKEGTLVIFLCNHCPYVIHVQHEIAAIARDYLSSGIATVGIASNDAIKYPSDSPDQLKEQAKRVGFNFPYLFDESQQVAKAYDAACTPDFYLFDRNDACFYRGRMDGSRPGNNEKVTGMDLRAAIEQLINGGNPPEVQHPSMGCNIKWKG